MTRIHPAAAATALAVAGAAIAAPAADAASRYCSVTGDVCISTPKRAGKQRLVLQTFSFRGKVKICVTKGSRSCKTFRLRNGPPKGLFHVDVQWSRHFPDRGKGTYKVTFTPSASGRQIGPALTFRR